MSSAEVTRKGLRHVRPGREAVIGASLGRASPRAKRRRGGETPVVPDVELSSYYGKPIINPPVWQSPDIPAYLFFGGLAGASSVLGAAAELTGSARVAKNAKVTAAAAIGISVAALIHDLGRPSRFYNMLRVFKPTSPMSVGSWLLASYGPLAAASAASTLSGVLPPLGRAATIGAAVLGPGVASYTAALLSDTAVPAWHEGHRELPFVFCGSAMTAAAGASLLGAPCNEGAPAKRLAVLGVLSESVAALTMEKRMGDVAKPYRSGKSGILMRGGAALAFGGVALGLVSGRWRWAPRAAGAMLLGASALTRWGIFEAGLVSAKDPAYTVALQRKRRDDRLATTLGS
ncbi:MAG: NrfD/PsrC family molybdoenzyme membrane anchor subunit [Acidimicrobiales bacterium]